LRRLQRSTTTPQGIIINPTPTINVVCKNPIWPSVNPMSAFNCSTTTVITERSM
jgi:hypothetical protein